MLVCFQEGVITGGSTLQDVRLGWRCAGRGMLPCSFSWASMRTHLREGALSVAEEPNTHQSTWAFLARSDSKSCLHADKRRFPILLLSF